MSGLSSRHALLLLGALVFPLSFDTEVAAQPGYVPVLQSGPGLWTHPFGVVFPPTPNAAAPTWQDPTRPFVTARTWHIPDLSHPNLMPWAKEVMKKQIAELDKGKLQF